MQRITPLFIASLALAAGCGGHEARTGSTTTPVSGSQISLEAAREIALRAVPGTVVDEEYEQERDGWVYGFEIRPADGGATQEVEIDAASGKVLEVEEADDDEQEGDHDDDDDDGDDGDD